MERLPGHSDVPQLPPSHGITRHHHGGSCKSRSALDFLRDRWRSDVLHHAAPSPSTPTGAFPATVKTPTSTRRFLPVRRCYSQPIQDQSSVEEQQASSTAARRSRFFESSSRMSSVGTPPTPSWPPSSIQRDVGVQCSIIEWSPFDQCVVLGSDIRRDIYDNDLRQRSPVDIGPFFDVGGGAAGGGSASRFSSQEISLVATDGSCSTTTVFGGADEQFDDYLRDWSVGYDNQTTGSDDQAFINWYLTASSTFVGNSSMPSAPPPPKGSRSLAALACVPRAPMRIERLRREFRRRRGVPSSADTETGGARSPSCHSEPEVVRCCSATAAAASMGASRVDVAAWRRQFQRRRAITLSDLDVEHQALISNGSGGGCRKKKAWRQSPAMSTESLSLGGGGRSFSLRSAATQHRSVRHCEIKC